MEEEKIIITNEENNYNAIDIDENTDEATYDETTQVIEVAEPESYTINVDEAFSPLGEQNEQLNHNLMQGRDFPDQHPISAITGLRQELDNIESLKTVESDKKGYANYYMWDTSKELPSDNRVGYFVSIHTKDHKISICGDTTYNDGSYNPIKNRDEIFGVTVDSAGFVGWQHYDEEDKPRNEKEYALVANTGIVKVRCFPSVVAGNYVMSSSDGRAKRTDNSHGYYVISIDEIDGNRCAVISLDSTMNQLYGLSKEVDSFNQRVDNVEVNTVAAINAANAALKKELITGINSAVEGSQAALNRTEELGDTVDNLEETVVGMKVQIDAVSDDVVIAAQEEAQKAVAELVEDAVSTSQEINNLRNRVTEAENDIKEAHDAAVGLYNEINPLIEFNDEGGVGVSGVVATVKDNTSQLGLMSTYLSNDYETIDTWNKFGKDMSKIYYVEDEREYYYYDEHGSPPDWYHSSNPTDAGLSEVIASLRQDLNKDSSQIEGLTSYIGKSYETVSTWDWYDTVDVFDSGSADSFIIYKDSSGQYWHCDINAPDGVNPWSTFTPTVTFIEKDIDTVYYAKDTGLYYYYNNGWHTTESSAAKLVESMAMTRQKADKNGASIETIVSYIGGEGSTIAGVKKFVDDTKAEINSLTSYIENDYIELEEEWTEEGKLHNKIYVTVDNGIKTYHYYRSYGPAPGWYNSTNPADAGLKTSIANVQQQVTDNETSISKLISKQDETNNAVGQLQMKVDDTGASLESLVMNISRYSLGKYSQAYGLSVAEAIELLRDGTVFVPTGSTTEYYSNVIEVADDTEATEKMNSDTNHVYSYRTSANKVWYYSDSKWTSIIDDGTAPDTVFNATHHKSSFTKDRYYTWDNKNGIWIESASGGVSFGTGYTNGDDTLRYFVVEDGRNQDAPTVATKTSTVDSNENPLTDIVYYITKDAGYFLRHTNGDVVEWYEVGALYHWELKNENDENSAYWKRVATLESNTLNRAISQMRQTANENTSMLTNVKGDLVQTKAELTNEMANYVTETAFDNKVTEIKQQATEDSAEISMLVALGVVKKDTIHTSDLIDENKVYYDKTKKLYFYCNSNGIWNHTNSITDENVAKKIRSAGLVTTVDDTGNSVTKIRADKVNITADDINLNGYVTIESLKSNGTTEIDGSRIKTGILQSQNWSEDNGTGTQINLNDGSITTPNFKVDSSGNLTLNGVITANDLATSKKTTINGDNITTGAIQSDGFTPGSDGFSSVGTKFDLSNGSIVGKNLLIDSKGNLHAKGRLSTYYGNLTGMDIDGYSILWADTDGSMSGFRTSAISALSGDSGPASGLAYGSASHHWGYRHNATFSEVMRLTYDFRDTSGSGSPGDSGGIEDSLNSLTLFPLYGASPTSGDGVYSYLGKSNYPWTKGYFRDLSVTGTLDIGGNLDISGSLALSGDTVLKVNNYYHNTTLCANGGSIYIRPNGADKTSGQVYIQSNGNVNIDGDAAKGTIGQQTTLHIENKGIYMHDTQSISLSGDKRITKQLNGYIIVWLYYINGAAFKGNINYTFIPKAVTGFYDGLITVPLVQDNSGVVASKTLSITDNGTTTTISGNAYNDDSPNNKWVLKHIIGC